MLNLLIKMTERGLVPLPLIRVGIRNLCRERLRTLKKLRVLDPHFDLDYVERLKKSPVAVATDQANEQHYEVPAEFYQKVLGPYLKYSCGYWDPGVQDLARSEARALEISIARAEIRDGMKVLELGCGWGSLTLTMAQRFSKSQFVAISNSSSQREFIESKVQSLGLRNVTILTRDVSQLEDLGADHQNFDRVVSIEMLEHFRNYEVLLSRISKWLSPQGKIFIHIFTHRQFPYLFETEGSDNWMGQYFFTGGQMPSQDLITSFQKDFAMESQWTWPGSHYQKTSEAWLHNHRKHKNEILDIFAKTYGKENAGKWFHRWEIFFLAVSELFGYSQGEEWGVSHYLLKKRTL